MVLSVRDAKPEGIAFVDAYTAIRSWFSYNAHLPSAASARNLIAALPTSAEVSAIECKAVFAEVINGGLEWAYNQSDGRFNISAYAVGRAGDRGRRSHPECRRANATAD